MDKDLIFLNQRIYPNASDIFSVDIKSIDEIFNECIFILDTNVLLLPYTTTSSGFDEIKKAFSKLIEKKQLFIPAQVAREFAKNRPEKIKNLFQQLNNIKSKVNKPSTGQYPLLESLTEYKEAIELEKQIQEVNSKYSKKISELLDEIKNWRWNDPISSVYRDLFKPEFIVEISKSEDDIINELERRNKYNIPPGFNDKSKDDLGVGDLIIWFTILEIAKEKNKDIIFVSGDEKNDWFYRSENQSLYPRFELITEFKNTIVDRTFHIIKLSQLLNLLGATEEAVQEVQINEFRVNTSVENIRTFINNIEKVIFNWLKQNESEKDITFNRGYPDFIIKDNEKTEGVDVIAFRNVRNVILSHRIRERYMKAYYEIHEGDVDCFRLIIVLQDEDSLELLSRYLTSNSSTFRNEFIEIVAGYISEENDFIRMI